MAKVAVTGGAGFIGSNLVRLLLDSGYQVKVLDNFSTGLASNLHDLKVDIVDLDICNFESLRQNLRGIDVIVHLAARGSVPRSLKDPRKTLEVNTFGTLNLLEVARENGAHLIFSSSSSVYGANTDLPKHEEMWLRPLSPYAASKLAAEGLVSSYSTSFGTKVTPLRFFNVFGPWQRHDHEYAAVLPKWIWKAMHGEAIELQGDGEQTRDFTYIETVCEVILAAIEHEICTSEIINLAYGNNISLNQIIKLLKSEFPNLEVLNAPTRIGDIRNSQNNPERLKRLFPNVKPKPFEESLSATISWMQKLESKS